jgi:dTDP-4-dehydrorhamnose 3,5-epimerase
VTFEETAVVGAVVVVPEPMEDERGAFARTVDRDEFAARGLATDWVQCSTSYSRRSGTLRGMHYQAAPHEEAKLVRCTRGAIYDVALDLRPGSAGICSWAGVELSADNRRALHVPPGCAHGFLTLLDDTEILYMMDAPYVAAAARGVRWDDPAFAIAWPVDGKTPLLAARDAAYPDWTGTAG